MAKLNLKTYVNHNSKSKAYGRTYARLQATEIVDTSYLCRHIQKHGSVFTAAEVKGVTEKFVSCIVELLLEGYKVKLDGLGIFYLSVSTTGEENPEDFGIGNVRSIRVRFLGDRSKESEYASAMLKHKASFHIIGKPTDDDDQQGGGDDDGEEDRP